MEDKNMNMIIEARSTHVYRGGGPNHKEDMSRLCAMEVKSTRSTGESIRKRGKQYHKVRYVGVPIIVLGYRLSIQLDRSLEHRWGTPLSFWEFSQPITYETRSTLR